MSVAQARVRSRFLRKNSHTTELWMVSWIALMANWFFGRVSMPTSLTDTIGMLYMGSSESMEHQISTGLWRTSPYILTMRADGRSFSAVDLMKNSKLLNNVIQKARACISFVVILRAVIAYVRGFDESYPVPRTEARILNDRRDMQSANFIPGVGSKTYNRYIHAARLCLRARPCWTLSFGWTTQSHCVVVKQLPN